MAVQAQHLSHAFPHPCNRALEDGSLFSDERGGRAPVVAEGIGNTVLSDLTFNGEGNCKYGFVPRKRARVVAEAPCFPANQQRFVGTPSVVQGLVPVAVGDVLSRAMGSGAASTSGRMGNAAGMSQGSLSLLYHQGLENRRACTSRGTCEFCSCCFPCLVLGIKILGLVEWCLIRLDFDGSVQTERMRAGLEEARRRHVRALVAAAERAAAGRLRAAEAALEVERCRNAELEERLRQISAEWQAWIGVAKSHEAAAAGLRATIDQILQSPCPAPAGEGDAEDAQSCCYAETHHPGADNAASRASAACKSCGEGEACVLLLPCRHLCLCGACDAAVDTCPVCAATKNASLHVLLS